MDEKNHEQYIKNFKNKITTIKTTYLKLTIKIYQIPIPKQNAFK